MWQSIGARYVPKFSGTYDPSVSYEALEVVSNGHSTLYIAKIPVPAGTPLTNGTYWTIYSAGSGAEANLQAQIDSINDDINDMKDPDVVGSLENQITSLSSALKDIFYRVDPSMSQTEIKDVIANYQNVYFSPGNYVFDIYEEREACLTLRSNQNIWVDGNIRIGGNAFQNYAIFDISNCTNVHVFGKGTLRGDKLIHTATTGEWGHCVNISDSTYVTVEGLLIRNAWGDGIYIGGSSTGSSYIRIEDIIADDNRRNGISIVNAQHVIVNNSSFTNTSGTAPQSGIALETNSTSDHLDDISINNCVSSGNAGNPSYVSSHVSGSVFFNGCQFLNPSGTRAFAVTSLRADNKLQVVMDGCIYVGNEAVDCYTNSNSSCIISGAIMKNLITTICRLNGYSSVFTGCHNFSLEAKIVDSVITEGVGVFPQAVTDSKIVVSLINSTIADVRAETNFGDNPVLIDTEEYTPISTNNFRIGSSVTRYIFDDTTLGNRIDLTDNFFFDSCEYIIVNKSTSTTMNIIGSPLYPIVKASDFNLPMDPNDVMIIKRHKGLLTFQKFKASWI
jgi:hypothetical protein